MSLLFFAGDFVYKVKKPVDLGYLDYSTLSNRKRFCEQEVLLNRRLCADVYLGVVPITLRDAALRVEGTGDAVEYAVKMRRLPQDRMLDQLLATGQADSSTMDAIAARVAAFHSSAAATPDIAAFGRLETIRANTDENFAQTLPYVGRTITRTTHDLLERYTNGYLDTQRPLLERRVAEGRIRDCHGDLHVAHVCLTDNVCIYDCIEFNDRFRYGDVASEVAFLAMDLDRFRRSDLSRRFVDSYVTDSSDAGVSELLPFYACYRAVVRGKVEGFKLNDPLIPDGERRSATWLARTYFQLARRYATGSGLLVVMSGVTGTGKSTIANRLSELLAGAVLSSDVVRKQLAGLSPERHAYEPFGEGIYSPEWTRQTYDELMRMALSLLTTGGCVILDASFLRNAERERACALAARTGSQLLLIECTAPRDILLARLAARQSAGSISDGRPEILDGQMAVSEPVSGQATSSRISIDTSTTIENIMEVIWGRL
ncbi:MAG: AAA family ATPase [Dehalococcoidia bacterium]|nr:AAA family ATPase [Dehalococcoidia bacterium]